MNPLMLFMFAFLAVCFSLILLQRDLNPWQKLSLLINPALLVLVILVMMDVKKADLNRASELAESIYEIDRSLASDDPAVRSAAAAGLRNFSTAENDPDSLKNLISVLKNTEKTKKTSQVSGKK